MNIHMVRIPALLGLWGLTLCMVSPVCPDSGAGSPALLLLILDLDDLMCQSCLFTVDRLVREIPPEIQKERVRGIVVRPREEAPRDRERSLGILAKKVRGFSKAHDIDFPISLDEAGFFRSLAEEGSAAVVLSGDSTPTRRFPFPMDSRAVADVLALLLE